MKIIFILAFLITPLFAMTEKELLAIAKIEHNRERLIPELAIFPDAREYSLKFKILHPENLPQLDKVTAFEKVVKGKYVVSEITIAIGDLKEEILLVMTYSKDLKAYKKWSLNKSRSELKEYLGLRIPNTKSISWIKTASNVKNDMQELAAESFTENGISWIENYYKDGKLVYSFSGTAIKTK